MPARAIVPVLTQLQQEGVLKALGYSDYGIDQTLEWLAQDRAQWVIDCIQRILDKLVQLDALIEEERLDPKPRHRNMKRIDDVEYFRSGGTQNYLEAAASCIQELSRLVGLGIRYDKYTQGMAGASKVANYGCGAVGRLY